MSEICPTNRPKITKAEFLSLIAPFKIDRGKYPLVVGGIRGYFLDMGKPGVNDRGLYDDAIILDTPTIFLAFNGNTDPTKYRQGHGTGSEKGMACLKPGVYYAHQFGYHHAGKPNQYPALVQTGGPVTVIRDGNPSYEDTGYFGINIHSGGVYGTSSEGCQTLPSNQWKEFYTKAESEAKRLFGEAWRQVIIPYILIDKGV